MYANIPIAAAVLSVLVITAFVRLVQKVAPWRLCPLCAGVAATWLWILAGLWLGRLEAEEWRLVAAIAMGGSVVGIAYKIEEKSGTEGGLPLVWKVFFVIIGFSAAYFALNFYFRTALVTAIAFAVMAVCALIKHGEKKTLTENKAIAALKKQMKNCC